MGSYLFFNFVFVIDLLKQQRTIQYICNWVNEIINFDYIWNRLRFKNFCNSFTVEGHQWGSQIHPLDQNFPVMLYSWQFNKFAYLDPEIILGKEVADTGMEGVVKIMETGKLEAWENVTVSGKTYANDILLSLEN